MGIEKLHMKCENKMKDTVDFTSSNRDVPSIPAPFIISGIPPGWYSRYGVILYTLPEKIRKFQLLLKIPYPPSPQSLPRYT